MHKKNETHLLHTLLIHTLLISLLLLLPACSDSAGENATDEDGDIQPAIDGDEIDSIPWEADTQEHQPAPDGDEAGDRDEDDNEASEEEDVSPTDGDDDDLPPIDGDETDMAEMDETVTECDNVADAQCFDNAPAGAVGYRCQGDVLLYCQPSVPTPPVCSTSVCDCFAEMVCEEGCIDESHDGSAQCVGVIPDGDIETSEEDWNDTPEQADLDPTEETDLDPIDTPIEDGDIDQTDTNDTPIEDGDIDTNDTSDTFDEESDMEESAGEADEPACLDDEFEPNDSAPQAVTLSPGTYEDLAICPFNKDWFHIDLAEGDEMTVRLDFPAYGADLDFFILDYDYQPILQAMSDDPEVEEATIVAEQAGAYYLYVFDPDGGANEYAMSLTIPTWPDGDEEIELEEIEIEKELEEIEICLNDRFYPNDNFSDAASVGGAIYNDLHLCPDELDFYQINLSEGDRIDINVLFAHANANISLYVYDEYEGGVYLSATSMNDNETLSFWANQDTYYFKIFAADGREADYSLQIDIQTSLLCQDDSYEENDRKQEAALLPAGNFENLKICGYDQDWYAFELEGGEGLKVEFYQDRDDGNLQTMLYNEADEILDISQTTFDTETLVYNAPTAQTVYALAYSPASVQIPYEMEVEISPTHICDEDIYEDNDNFSQAYLFEEEATIEDLVVCRGDGEDWFKFHLDAGHFLTADILYPETSGPFQIAIYQNEETPLAWSREIEGGRQSYVQAPVEGDYHLMIKAVGLNESPYSLSWSVCPEDIYEENDDMYSATFLNGETQLFNLALCGEDEVDWFAANVYAGSSMRFAIGFSAYEGDLDIIMYNGLGEILAQSTGSGDVETIDYYPTESQSVYFKVFGYEGANNSYYLTYQYSE